MLELIPRIIGIYCKNLLYQIAVVFPSCLKKTKGRFHTTFTIYNFFHKF